MVFELLQGLSIEGFDNITMKRIISTRSSAIIRSYTLGSTHMQLLQSFVVKACLDRLSWGADAGAWSDGAAYNNRHFQVLGRRGDDIGGQAGDMDALRLVLIAGWDDLQVKLASHVE